MTELYYPNLDDEELLRIAQDSTDPLVEELVKRMSKALDVGDELRFTIRELETKVAGLETYIDRKRGLKD